MKPMLLVLVFSSIFISSCKKEDDAPPASSTVSELLSGTYVGPSALRYTSLEEIFTSQYESHYVMVKDSTFIDFDTLRVREISRDSFVMEGRIGGILSQWLDHFAWSEMMVDSNQVYTLKRSLWHDNIGNGYTIIFDAENQTAEVVYEFATYSSWGVLNFEGTK